MNRSISLSSIRTAFDTIIIHLVTQVLALTKLTESCPESLKIGPNFTNALFIRIKNVVKLEAKKTAATAESFALPEPHKLHSHDENNTIFLHSVYRHVGDFSAGLRQVCQRQGKRIG